MKAVRAILVLGLFVFLDFGVQAQNSIRRVNKNEVKSNMAPQKTQASFQVQQETPKVKEPDTATPIPSPHQNTGTTTTTPKSNTTQKSNEFKAAPNSSGSQNNSIQLNTKQSKALEQRAKQRSKK